MRPSIPPGRHLMTGNQAVAEGALTAGCRFYAGYPITPTSDLMEHMARRLPELGGVFVQMEDEIASIMALVGASWAGAKAMTATSGPGFSLMQEGIGFAAMTETPLVIVNGMRGGPSTGQATMPAQGDVPQARFGSHGDYELVAFMPSTVQEAFEVAIKAFNTAEALRIPVVILTDANLARRLEDVTVAEEYEVLERRRGDVPFRPVDESLVPPMPLLGEGKELLVTGSTHREDGIRVTADPDVHERLVRRLVEKVLRNRDVYETYEELWTDDADALVVALGSAAIPAKEAVRRLRERGRKIGFFRPISVWPPPRRMMELSEGVEEVFLVQLSLRGYLQEVERIFSPRRVRLIPYLGGRLPTPPELEEVLT
ncbi:MAG: 2-oxoacid:acceptor oxidoreductase subunit alpha [Thermoplasmata archaeon]|nr:MAG: 2-oxoacid:acceptor oxidoreductase subunit alpha [Thermoplasmata archaeon]